MAKYDILKQEFESVPNDEWNAETKAYALGQLHMAWEDGEITEEQMDELREQIPMSNEESWKVWWLS